MLLDSIVALECTSRGRQSPPRRKVTLPAPCKNTLVVLFSLDLASVWTVARPARASVNALVLVTLDQPQGRLCFIESMPFLPSCRAWIWGIIEIDMAGWLAGWLAMLFHIEAIPKTLISAVVVQSAECEVIKYIY